MVTQSEARVPEVMLVLLRNSTPDVNRDSLRFVHREGYIDNIFVVYPNNLMVLSPTRGSSSASSSESSSFMLTF